MAEEQEFVKAWDERFPGEVVPHLTCFDSGQCDESKLQNTLQSVNKGIEELRMELKQQEFVSDFLVDLLNGGKDRIVPRRKQQDRNNFNGTELETSGPLSKVSLDPEIDSVDGTSEGQGEVRAWRLSRSQSRPSGDVQVEIPDSCFNRSGSAEQSFNKGNRQNGTSVKQIVISESSHGAAPVVVGHTRSPDHTTEHRHDTHFSTGLAFARGCTERHSFGPSSSGSKSLSHIETLPAGSRSSLTDSEKVKAKHALLTKTWSERGCSTAEKKHKPPVPAPRPSIKGPSFKRQGSGGSFKGGLYRSESSDSTVSTVSSVSTDSMLQEAKPEAKDIEKQDVPSSPKNSFKKKVPMLKPLGKNRRSSTPTRDPQSNESDSPSSSPKLTGDDNLMVNEAKADDSGVEAGAGSPFLRRSARSRYPHCYANVDIDANRQIIIGADVGSTNTDTLSMGSHDTEDEDSEKAIYDNPIMARDDADDTSSEDEEPIYYNIMLMKKHQMENVSMDAETIYASVDLQKRDLERKAKRLSKRFSQHFDSSIEAPPLPAKLSPFNSEDEVESTDSGVTPSTDSVFLYPATQAAETPDSPKPQHVSTWKKRSSMLRATECDTGSTGSVSSEPDELDQLVPTSAEVEKLHMRKWVVTSILDSEHNYVNMLDVLLHYMRSLQAAATTSQPVIPVEDISVIFYHIPELHQIHSKLIQQLEPRVETWKPDSEVAEIFKMMAVEEYPIATDYLKNYQKAVATIQKCSQENPQFAALTKEIKCKPEVASLEELLHKPVVRIQRNTLVLHDLIKFTPTSHTDYDMLQKTLTLTHQFLDNFKSPLDSGNSDQQRYLVKNNMIVEKVGNNRKLRHVFLFNDVIVCTKQKLGGRNKLHFDVKWYIPLKELNLSTKISEKENKQVLQSRRVDLENLQKRVNVLQGELRSEIRKNKSAAADNQGRQWSLRGNNTRTIEKLKKKLAEQETELVMESPHLVFKLKGKSGKPHYLLVSSDYERNDWRETINGLKNKGPNVGNLNTVELQNQINSLSLPKINAITNLMEKDDWELEEEHLYGALNITIHRMLGLKGPCDTFVTAEVDSYSHFSLKAKTNTICNSAEPKWNEDFEIDLDGAQTLRILCYKLESDSNVLLGKCALELSKAWLRGDFQEKTISLNEEVQLTISLGYASREQTLKRTPSSAKSGLFGVHIQKVAKREGMKVPAFVRACVKEVEKRGMDDLGIYRISGLSSEIQRIKKGLERNVTGALPLLEEVDVNVVTGLLKLYLRELPEALFTDKLYPSFIEGMSLSDPEAKQKCMLSIFRALPEPNFSCVMFLIDHMLRVSAMEEQNKMTLQNLATVFGPTLLRPAAKPTELTTMDLFSAGARDAMLQTGILYFFLTLRVKGADFTKQG